MSLIYIVNFYIAKILPFFTLSLFIFQFFCNWFLYSDIEIKNNIITFNITKCIYFFLYFMSLISFIMTCITEPGYVTEETNEQFLYLYQKTHIYSLNKADIYNEKHNLNEIDDDSDLYTDGLSSDDETKYKESQYLINLYNDCKKYKKKLNFDVKKCRQCHIIKVCGTSHCSICHKCVYMKDHHCIWFNQCIGQFNLKYFINFAFYLLLCSLMSFMRLIYYILYKNYVKLFSEFSYHQFVIFIFSAIFDLIYIIFSFNLLFEQYTNLYYFCVIYDNKKHKIIEIRTKYKIICEIFGEEFGIGWFLPFKPGGYYELIKNKKVTKVDIFFFDINDKSKVKNQ